MNTSNELERNAKRNAGSAPVTWHWRDVGEGTIGHDDTCGNLIVIERCSRTVASLGLTWRWSAFDRRLRAVAGGLSRTVQAAKVEAVAALAAEQPLDDTGNG